MVVVGEEICSLGNTRRELSVIDPPLADVLIQHWTLQSDALALGLGQDFALVLTREEETISTPNNCSLAMPCFFGEVFPPLPPDHP